MRTLPTLVLTALALPLAPPASAQTSLTAWHEDGQTWLVWTDNQVFTGSEHWSIYKSPSPIVDINNAELIGRLFPHDTSAGYLRNADPAATWTVPDPSGPGTITLAANEALFVYTPHAAVDEYFAVVKEGNVALAPDNTAGPVMQTTDPVRPHEQLTGVDAGHPYTVYATWIDGRDDDLSGRPDFSVMGPASMHGVAKLFSVFEPQAGLPAAPMPMVAFLHGGGGNFWNYRPSKGPGHEMHLDVEDGLYVTFGDRLHGRSASTDPDGVVDVYSRWFGFCREYDRFEPLDTRPSDLEVVVDHTHRWLEWALDWLVAERDVDSNRVALAGLSMGGRGTGMFVRHHPERISSATAFVMPTAMGDNPGEYAPAGSVAQNLVTNLPGGVRFNDFAWPTTRLSTVDLPFMRFIDGTNDTKVGWAEKPGVYDEIQQLRWGTALYWDERGHTSGAGWFPARFVGSPRHSMAWLTQYQSDRSFPAFHDVDHALSVAGVQPDPGDAVEPANGNPWGTWGGWFEWDATSIVDTPERWAVTLGLVTSSTFAPDVAPTLRARASVTIRRAQAFDAQPGEGLAWTLRNAGTGALRASGLEALGADGTATLSNLPFGPARMRLEVRRVFLETGFESR